MMNDIRYLVQIDGSLTPNTVNTNRQDSPIPLTSDQHTITIGTKNGCCHILKTKKKS